MIKLEKGQKLFDNEGMVVYDQTGYYNDGDSIICAMSFAPEEPACRYEAKFIAYGNAVYNVTDPDMLLEEIKKIDPNTLFGKNKEEIAVDQTVENIQMSTSEDLSTPQNTEVSPTIDSPSPAVIDAPLLEPDPIINTNTGTTTPNIVSESMPSTNASTSSSTISSVLPETSTTTISSVMPDTSTSTQNIVSATGTTTEAIIEPVVQQVVPAIENVIDQLNTISDIVTQVATSSSDSLNLQP